jgi:glucose-6-phosphate isomerase
MPSLSPAEIQFDATTGALSPVTGQYRKHLSELEGVFQDADAWARLVDENSDPLVYEVNEYKKESSDLFFGTTTMQPGKVGEEYFMTRGHFHQNRDMGEFYCTQNGQGLLMLQDREGNVETVDMRPGGCAFIPPDWAHRSINTGPIPLVFTWFCSVHAGHDYAAIAAKGMKKLALEGDGGVRLVPNPNFQG